MDPDQEAMLAALRGMQSGSISPPHEATIPGVRPGGGEVPQMMALRNMMQPRSMIPETPGRESERTLTPDDITVMSMMGQSQDGPRDPEYDRDPTMARRYR